MQQLKNHLKVFFWPLGAHFQARALRPVSCWPMHKFGPGCRNIHVYMYGHRGISIESGSNLWHRDMSLESGYNSWHRDMTSIESGSNLWHRDNSTKSGSHIDIGKLWRRYRIWYFILYFLRVGNVINLSHIQQRQRDNSNIMLCSC